jgi:hypothetical protein
MFVASMLVRYVSSTAQQQSGIPVDLCEIIYSALSSLLSIELKLFELWFENS